MKSPYSQHPSLPRGRPTVLLVGLLAAAALPAAGQFSTARAVAPSGLDAWTAAGGSPETSSYVHDDGVSESAVGLTAGGTTAWLHRFDAVGGADVITQLSAAYGTAMAPGSGMPVGAPYTVGLGEG